MRNLLCPRKEKTYSLNHIYPDDVFLIGFPKCGNTWLRFLIGNYLTSNRCDFTNSHLIIPGVKDAPEVCNQLRRPRFMTGHLTTKHFQRLLQGQEYEYPKVIFITRDGRDAVVSYYYHVIKHRQIPSDTVFAEYLALYYRGKFYPQQTWGEYTKLWLDYLSTHYPNHCIVRYEDMKSNVEDELSRIIQFSGLALDKERIRSAVDSSNFETMQKLEESQQEKHERLKGTDKTIRFVREGSIGQWEKHFNEDMLKQFLKSHKAGLQRLGYQ